MEAAFYRYNPWWEEDYTLFDSLHERRDHFEMLKQQLDNKQIVFLTGLRRIGKTSLMQCCIKHLIQDKKVNPLHVFYISMDDYLLLGTPILTLVDQYRAMHKIKSTQKVYLFLDEITFAADYDIQLKNMYDSGKVKIFASSSSASLLKAQNTLLTGRKTTIEVLPLSFSDYLHFKAINIRKADAHLRETYFRDYLKTGGIPEFVKTGDDAYIRELIDDIIYKDIAAAHGIRQINQLKNYFLLLMERSGNSLSINKIARILGISTETSKRYFDYFCDTFVVYPVTRYGKLNEQLVSPKKIYACDTGIKTYYHGERDWGALFENYVFLRLKHLNLSYLYENATEIDFMTENQWLLECKFNDMELSPKQRKLFENYEARKKFVIRNENDIDQIRALAKAR